MANILLIIILGGVLAILTILLVRKRNRKPEHEVAFEMQAIQEGVKQNRNAIILTDAHNKIIFWNGGAERILGISATVAHGKDLSIVGLHLPDTMRLDTPIDMEAKHGLGSMLPISITVSESKVGKTTNYMAIIKSIMQRKEREKVLHSEIELLTLGEYMNGTGSWSWNVSTARVQCSHGLNEIWGEDDFSSDFEELMKKVWWEDEPRVRTFLNAAMADEKDYAITYRITQPNGKPQWILARGKKEYTEAGKLEYIKGTVQKIKDEKGTVI